MEATVESAAEAAEPAAEAEQPLHDLMETYQNLNVRNVLESYHDAQQSLDTAMSLFSSGYLPLDQRSAVENLYWAICRRISKLVKQMEFVPEELEGLEASLSDTYFCNFSLFQSIPDSWAIKQLFPVMPIHRLDERPTREAVLGDVGDIQRRLRREQAEGFEHRRIVVGRDDRPRRLAAASLRTWLSRREIIAASAATKMAPHSEKSRIAPNTGRSAFTCQSLQAANCLAQRSNTAVSGA